MTISEVIRDQVRERANFACEYCGVTETDTCGLLTIDHYRPRAYGGTDDIENLVYCCFYCNLYKADYWSRLSSDPALWNPRQAARTTHLLVLDDGRVYPTTLAGEFTIERLRLNRPPLVAYRMRQRLRIEEERLLKRYGDALRLLEELRQQQIVVLEEQRALLEEQRAWLRLLREGEG